MFNDPVAFKLPRRLAHEGAVNIETITADKTLDFKDGQYQILTNSKGSIAVVKLPPKENGIWFWVTCSSSSAHTINIKDADNADVIATPNLGAGKACLLVCDGENWGVALEQV
jgi:hypothetical protein